MSKDSYPPRTQLERIVKNGDELVDSAAGSVASWTHLVCRICVQYNKHNANWVGDK
jgi:hypothetical protein